MPGRLAGGAALLRPAPARYAPRPGLRGPQEGLDKNPLTKGNLPEGWTPPGKPEEALDPRSVGSPELVSLMLTYASYTGRQQGPRFVAFFGCMFWAMMRPAEVTSLSVDGCHPPGTGWGRLIFSESSPAAGREFTDGGQVHKDRGLKGRDRQAAHSRAARARAPRNVPRCSRFLRLPFGRWHLMSLATRLRQPHLLNRGSEGRSGGP